MDDFTNPAYFAAVWAAVKYGLVVCVGMIAAGGILVGISGGPAAKNWEDSHAH